VNLDGVYYGQGRIINEGFFDMAQVEILRGPQALFFGKNASAGVISFRSADPGNHFEALARAGYEFEGKVTNFEGVVSGPVTDTTGLRLAVRSADMSGGYIQNVAPGHDHDHTQSRRRRGDAACRAEAAAGSARRARPLHPSDGPVHAVRSVPAHCEGGPHAVPHRQRHLQLEMVDCPKGVAQNDPGENCVQDRKSRQNDLPADIAATNPLLGRHGGRLYQHYDAYAVSANAAYTGDEVDITSVTGLHRFVNYFLGDYDYTANVNGGTWGSERSKYKAFSEEIRTQTKLEGPLNFMGGAYFQKTRLDFDQQIIFPGALENSLASDPTKRYITVAKLSYTDGNTFAAFGQAQWRVTLEVDAGARYTHETKDSRFVQPYVISAYQPVFRENHPIAANQSFNDLSPEVTLTYTPRDKLMAFVGYKQGFKSGGFSGSALDSAIGNTISSELTSASPIDGGVLPRGAVGRGVGGAQPGGNCASTADLGSQPRLYRGHGRRHMSKPRDTWGSAPSSRPPEMSDPSPSVHLDDVETCIRLGLEASREQRVDQALELFQRAARLSPQAGLPHFLIGAELAQLGRMDEAEAAYANAVLLAPALDMARYQLGLVQFTSGRPALALVTWGPLFERSPTEALQRVVHGFAALAQDRFDSALACFREAIEANVDNPPLTRDLNMMIERIEGRAKVMDSTPPSGSAEQPQSEEQEGLHVLLSNYQRQGPLH
jgi:TonB dependent receptor/Tetratricopeptide repeat